MPPKASSIVTKKSVEDAVKNLTGTENPSEADFKVLLSAAKAGKEEKAIAATYIPSFFEKFPKQQKAALTAIVDLSTNEDIRVRTNAVRNLKKFYATDKVAIANALFAALGDEDERVVNFVSPDVVNFLKAEEEDKTFITTFFSVLKDQKPLAQCQMISFAKDEIKFTEENVDKLLDVLATSFKSAVIEGLELYRKNRLLIKEEQITPLVNDLLTRLDNSLDQSFAEVCDTLLLPLFKFTRTLGSESTTRLLDIIAEKVIPKFDEIQPRLQLAVVQKIADVARFAEGDKLLVEIYNKIYLNFPTENSGKINFSIIEATLFAFIKLAQKNHIVASNLIGTVLCYTGQPGEADDSKEDEAKKTQFKKRLEYLQTVAPNFVAEFEGKILMYTNMDVSTEEDRKKKAENIQEAKKAKKTGNNIRHLARLLLSDNPLSGNMPNGPSWKKAKLDNQFNNSRRNSSNSKFGRNRNFDRNRDNDRSRDNERSRDNNRPRGRFNNNRDNDRSFRRFQRR